MNSLNEMLSKTKYGVTLTFGECAENHVGMEKIGEKSMYGFTYDELKKAKEKFKNKGFK